MQLERSLQRGRARAGAEWLPAVRASPARGSMASTGPRPRGRGMCRLHDRQCSSSQRASTGPRPRGRGMRVATSGVELDDCELQRGRARAGAECAAVTRLRRDDGGFNGAAPARARNVASLRRAMSRRANLLQRGRARAGAECEYAVPPMQAPVLRASTGPRPRGRGMDRSQQLTGPIGSAESRLPDVASTGPRPRGRGM